MSYNRFLELLLRKKSGELSHAEQEELNEFLKDKAGYDEFNGLVEQLYDAPLNEIRGVDNAYIKNRWKSLQKRTNLATQEKSGHLKYYIIAATSLAASLLIILFLFGDRGKTTHSNDVEVATKTGSKSSMKLPDGSTVWLNAGSKISYAGNFGESSRDVWLSGEAYFDVVHDADHPFIVHADNFDVKVLGTVFNIKSYEGDIESEATLIQGKIELVLKNDDSRKILLKPNEKFIFKATEESKIKAPDSLESEKPVFLVTGLQKPFKDSLTVETQWVQNCLAFRDTKLKDVALMISRWYGISVEISDEKLSEKSFSGIFKDESPDQVMQALKIAGGFHYSINKNKILIFP